MLNMFDLKASLIENSKFTLIDSRMIYLNKSKVSKIE